MRTLSLVGESLPSGKIIPVGPLNELIPLDPRHGVFPNLVMTPILSTLCAFDRDKNEFREFWKQVPYLLEKTDNRFNAFTKDTTESEKNPLFTIHPDMERRLNNFDVRKDLWAVFGFQTIFGLIRYLLTGEKAATKRQIKVFATKFLNSALENGTPESLGLPKKLPQNLSPQEGIIHRLCTDEDLDGNRILHALKHAIKKKNLFHDKLTQQIETLRCFVPLLHNEAYQMSPYGVCQANFSLAHDYDIKGQIRPAELYWKLMGKVLARRLCSQCEGASISNQE